MIDSIRSEQLSDGILHPISGAECHYTPAWCRRGRILKYSAAVDRPDPLRPPIWYGAVVISGNEERPEDELAIGFAESLAFAALIDEELRGPRGSKVTQKPFSSTPPNFDRIMRDAETIAHAVQLASICFPVMSFPSSGIPSWKNLTRREFDYWGNTPVVRIALGAAARKFIKVTGLCASHQSHGGNAVERTELDETAAVATFRVIYGLSRFGLGEDARHVLHQMSLIAKFTGRWSTTDILTCAKALFLPRSRRTAIPTRQEWRPNPLGRPITARSAANLCPTCSRYLSSTGTRRNFENAELASNNAGSFNQLPTKQLGHYHEASQRLGEQHAES